MRFWIPLQILLTEFPVKIMLAQIMPNFYFWEGQNKDKSIKFCAVLLKFAWLLHINCIDKQKHQYSCKQGIKHINQRFISSITHEVFGDIKKLLTQEFVRQGYLEMTRQPNMDPPVTEFGWGQRAKLETSKRRVLEFVSKVYFYGFWTLLLCFHN